MIKEVKMFTVICDNCGRDAHRGQEYSCWNDKGYAMENAIEMGWLELEGKIYCDYCYAYDEADTIEINSSRTIKQPTP